MRQCATRTNRYARTCPGSTGMSRGNCQWRGPFWSTNRGLFARPLSILTSRAALTRQSSSHGSTNSRTKGKGLPHNPLHLENAYRCSQRNCFSQQNCGRAYRDQLMLYSCEFLRVGNETNSLNLLCLHFNGQDEQGLAISADDHSRLSVDFRQLHTIVLWQKAHRSQAKTCHRITPDNRTKRGLFDFSPGSSRQGHPFVVHVRHPRPSA